jgi:hypothetical protein
MDLRLARGVRTRPLQEVVMRFKHVRSLACVTAV